MLRTRKIIKNDSGAYVGVYGQGEANWVTGGEALAQIITHQLLTIKGELTTSVNFGVSWFDHGNEQNEQTVKDMQIKRLIQDNPYVNRIISYSSTLDRTTNSMEVKIKVDTTEGLLELNL